MNVLSTEVGLVGVGRIGRHHAKWWSSLVGGPINTYDKLLTKPMDKSVVYTTLQDFLNKKWKVCDVCTPNETHYDVCSTALKKCNIVLCEKPLIYDRGLSFNKTINLAHDLLSLAKRHDSKLLLCSQHYSTMGFCLNLLKKKNTFSNVKNFKVSMFSPGTPHGKKLLDAWIDLSPHLFASLQRIVPEPTTFSLSDLRVEVIDNSIVVKFKAYSLSHQFCINCNFQVGFSQKTFLSYRINGHEFQISGKTDPNGIYSCSIVSDGISYTFMDPLQHYLKEVIKGKHYLSGISAIENLQHVLLTAQAINATC